MFNGKRIVSAVLFFAVLGAAPAFHDSAAGRAHVKKALLTATEVLEESKPCPISGYRMRCCPALTASP